MQTHSAFHLSFPVLLLPSKNSLSDGLEIGFNVPP